MADDLIGRAAVNYMRADPFRELGWQVPSDLFGNMLCTNKNGTGNNVRNQQTHPQCTLTHTHTHCRNKRIYGKRFVCKMYKIHIAAGLFLANVRAQSNPLGIFGVWGDCTHTHTHIYKPEVYTPIVCALLCFLEFRSSCVLAVWPCDGAHRASAPHRH